MDLYEVWVEYNKACWISFKLRSIVRNFVLFGVEINKGKSIIILWH